MPSKLAINQCHAYTQHAVQGGKVPSFLLKYVPVTSATGVSLFRGNIAGAAALSIESAVRVNSVGGVRSLYDHEEKAWDKVSS